MCMVVKNATAPLSGFTNSMSTSRPRSVATVWVLVYVMSHWPCWNRAGIEAGAPKAATLDRTFLISTKNGSTFVSEPPNCLEISMIDTVP